MKKTMETQERHGLTECPVNGTGCPPDASTPEVVYEADRLTVALVLAKKQHGVKVGEVTFVDQNQRPFVLFGDPGDPASPWGSSVEKFIRQALEQAEEKERSE